MTVKRAKADLDAEGFLRAAWDTLGDICLNYAVQVGYSVLPTTRRGVFLIRVRAFRAVPNGASVQAASWSQEFPNAQTQSFGGAFFRAANQLDRLLGEQQAQEKRAQAEQRPG